MIGKIMTRKTQRAQFRAPYLAMRLLFLFLASCQNSHAKYVLTGRVISKQPATQQLIIDNDDIPGFMPAMTMPYTVKDPDGFNRVQPADIIRADVVAEPDGKILARTFGRHGKGAAESSAGGLPLTSS